MERIEVVGARGSQQQAGGTDFSHFPFSAPDPQGQLTGFRGSAIR
jgi:hypothetical protein